MKLEEKHLKIFYEGDVNPNLEAELEKVLGTFGYKWWGSGMEIDSQVRDLAFAKEEHNATSGP